MTDPIYFIMIKPLPTREKQPYGPSWWDMIFVSVNGHPTPFASEEAVRDYMTAWDMSEPNYSIWKVEKVEA